MPRGFFQGVLGYLKSTDFIWMGQYVISTLEKRSCDTLAYGNCLMPVTPISQKHCFIKNCPKNLTNFGKFKFFSYSLLQFYRAFQWCIVCFHTLSGLCCTDQNVNQEIRGCVSFFPRLYVSHALLNSELFKIGLQKVAK